MKIKIIDLLVKISKHEKVPKKIRYDRKIYDYQEGSYDYLYYVENNGTMKFLITEVFNSSDNVLDILNEEVEIIEEDKKIEKIPMVNEFESNIVSHNQTRIKINEIIDKLNKEE